MKSKNIAIIGGGPTGFFAAISAIENSDKNLNIDIFEKNSPLKTILWTGNGRCNLSNNISDFKEFSSNYPRGEKFLYSVFSQFGVKQTLEWFNSNGMQTYVQEDNRIFPKTNKAETVRTLLLKKTAEYGINIKKNCVKDLSKENNKFFVHTESGSFKYDAVIISTGGDHRKNTRNGYNFAEKMGHTITELKPSLTSLLIREKWGGNISGVTIKNAVIQSFFNKKKIYEVQDDFLFTHKGLTGPAIFKTSAYCAYLEYSSQNPIVFKINFVSSMDYPKLERDLLSEINKFPNKSVLNTIKKYLPRSLTMELLSLNKINPENKVCEITKEQRKTILKFLTETELNVILPVPEGEIVTAGGIELKEIIPKTMESKLVKGLFFCGEILNIDGLTGGFNLQMCWSTGYIAGLNASNF